MIDKFEKDKFLKPFISCLSNYHLIAPFAVLLIIDNN